MISKFSSLALVASVLGFGLAASAAPQAAQAKSDEAQSASAASVSNTDGGHVIGDPNAPIKLTEYVSYTCSHCGNFAREGDPALKLVYVGSGKVALELRHIIRDVVDLTATLATNCGTADKFPMNHAIIMGSQEEWMQKAINATDAQKQRWATGDFGARRRALASDLGFYDLLESQGYSRATLDQCLSDDNRAKELIGFTERDARQYDIPGTPSFMINGALLQNVHSWEALQPKLDEAVAKQAESDR